MTAGFSTRADGVRARDHTLLGREDRLGTPSAPERPAPPPPREQPWGRWLDAVAASGLTGAGVRFPEGPLPSETWRRLLAGVRRNRLEGLLASSVAAGALVATREQAAEAARAHVKAMSAAVLLEQDLLEAVDLLEGAGIDHRLLKGPAVARLAYPEASVRVFRDIDLLVPSARTEEAAALLTRHGHRRVQARLRPGFDGRFAKSVTLTSPRGRSIDLHRTLVPGALGLTITPQDLFATSLPARVGGREVRCPGWAELVLHACYTVAVADVPPRRVALRDLAQLLLHAPVEEDRVLELAERWRGLGVVATAVNMTWDRFDLADAVPLSAWAASYRPGRREQRRLELHRQADCYAPQALATLAVLPGVRERAAFLRAVAFPGREFLEQRSTGRLGWLLRGWRGLLTGGGRS